MILCPQPGLPCGHTLTVEIRPPGLPFFNQLQRLPAAPLGTGKHALDVRSTSFW